MPRPKPKLKRVDLSYQYGFRSPQGEEVSCSSLAEARFYADNGAELLVREVETRRSDWTVISGADPS